MILFQGKVELSGVLLPLRFLCPLSSPRSDYLCRRSFTSQQDGLSQTGFKNPQCTAVWFNKSIMKGGDLFSITSSMLGKAIILTSHAASICQTSPCLVVCMELGALPAFVSRFEKQTSSAGRQRDISLCDWFNE